LSFTPQSRSNTPLKIYFDGAMNLDVTGRNRRCAEPVLATTLGAGVHEPDNTPKGNHFLSEKGVHSITREHRTNVEVIERSTAYLMEDAWQHNPIPPLAVS
jgi:hypothetical protein